MLVKDYKTHQKSFTVTAVLLTFLLVIICFVGVVTHAIQDNIIWAALGFHSIYVGLYWNKRVRAGSDGIELSTEEK